MIFDCESKWKIHADYANSMRRSGRVVGKPLKRSKNETTATLRESRYSNLRNSIAYWTFSLSMLSLMLVMSITTVMSQELTFPHALTVEPQESDLLRFIQRTADPRNDATEQPDGLLRDDEADKNNRFASADLLAGDGLEVDQGQPAQQDWPVLEWSAESPSAKLQTAVESELLPLNQVFAGYDEGFVIASGPDIKLEADSHPFRLRLNGWGQLRQSVFDSRNANPDLNQLEIKRARMVLSGHAFTPDLTYFVQIDGRSNAGERLYFLDYFLDYDIGHSQLDLSERTIGMKAGLYKLPFSFSRWASGKELQFADRSMASIFFDINRSLAWGLYGRTEVLPSPLDWEVALGNGFMTGQADTGNIGQLDNKMAMSARVSSVPIGTWGGNDIADLENHEQLTTRVGAGFAVSTIDRFGVAEFFGHPVVDSGRPLANILPPAADRYTVSLYSLDASLKYRGLSLTSEYYFRNISDIRGTALPSLFDHGLWLESGYFLVPTEWQVLARWSRVQGDSGTLGGRDRSSDEVAAGLVRYFQGQNVRMSLDVTHLNGATIKSPVLDIAPGDDGWLYRAQLQVGF